jgi:hypothetical protein
MEAGMDILEGQIMKGRLTQAHLLKIDGETATIQDFSKEFGIDQPGSDAGIELPEFPLWWLDKAKRNMEGLREIASHLHGKTESLRMSRGYRGEASEMEKQIINEQLELKQAMLHITDSLESLFQIVVNDYERRPSQRMKRTLGEAWHKTEHYTNRLWENPVFKVCGGLSTIAFICTAAIWTARHFGWLQ